MGFIDQADGDKKLTKSGTVIFSVIPFYVGLLQLDLTILAISSDGMLQFNFRKEAHIIGKLMLYIEYKAMGIDLVVATVLVVVVQLTVTTDMGFISPVGDFCVALTGRGNGLDSVGCGFNFLLANNNLLIGLGELLF